MELQTDSLLCSCPAVNSGLHAFDFLSNSILKEVHSALQKGKPGAFSPGKPAEFLANYKSSLKFLNFLEGTCLRVLSLDWLVWYCNLLIANRFSLLLYIVMFHMFVGLQ